MNDIAAPHVDHGMKMRRSLVHALSAAALLAVVSPVLTGCSGAARSATVQDLPPAPADSATGGAFTWESSSLEGAGTSQVISGGNTTVQRMQIARSNARVAALNNLKAQVQELPLSNGATVGDVMLENIGIKKAIEREIQNAANVSEREVNAGRFEVRVQLPATRVAGLLRQFGATPQQLPPAPPRPEGSNVSLVS